MVSDELAVRDEGFTVLSRGLDGIEPAADVVFIHGIQGHPERTWTCLKKLIPKPKEKSKSNSKSLAADKPPSEPKSDKKPLKLEDVFWPRDLLIDDFPSIRVLTYGYDSHVSKGFAAANQSGISGHGQKFLRALKRERQGASKRPLIFLAHSLGGIITKEALRQAQESKDSTENEIILSTFAIIFFGTPHRGSRHADLGQVVERAMSILFSTNSKLLDNLGHDGEVLERVRLDFVRILDKHKMKIYSFQEGKGLSGFKPLSKKVVENFSSTLDHSQETTEEINANHHMICKFYGRADEGYVQVKGVLSEYLREIDQKINEEQARLLNECCQSLYSPAINDRLHDIEQAESHTFEWIFAKNKSGFPEWLISKSSMFWVKGRPGSGKSTLIKYIVENETTSDILKSRWKTNMVQASFFFYDQANNFNSRSFSGLLRSLLFEILSIIPDLFIHIEALYQDTRKFGDRGWSRTELEKAVAYVGKQQDITGCICLFMDALDEYPGHCKEITRNLKCLIEVFSTGSITLKICASSRPLNEFEVMLVKFPGFAQIALHEWTVDDIEIIVSNWVKEADRGNMAKLCKKITSMAKGSFKWVNLVLNTLSSPLFHFASEDELLDMLYALPKDLNPFYERLLQSIPMEIRPKMQIILQLMFCNSNRPRPLTLSELSLATKLIDRNGDLLPNLTYSSVDNLKRCQELKTSLETCLGAFIEVVDGQPQLLSSPPQWAFEPLTTTEYAFITSTLRFSHKTAKDFIVSRMRYDFFEPGRVTDNILAGHINLCKLYTQLAKAKQGLCFLLPRIPLGNPQDGIDLFDTDLISYWATHAREAEYIQYMANTGQVPTSHDVHEFLELSWGGVSPYSTYPRAVEKFPTHHNVNSARILLIGSFNDAVSQSMGSDWVRKRWVEHRNYQFDTNWPAVDTFLAFVIICGLFLYAQDLLESAPSYPIDQQDPPLLFWTIAAIEFITTTNPMDLWRDEAERCHLFAYYLLKRGANPNSVVEIPFQQSLPVMDLESARALRSGRAKISLLHFALGLAIRWTEDGHSESTLAALELICILVENGAVVEKTLYKNYWVQRSEAEERSIIHFLTYPVPFPFSAFFEGPLFRRTIRTLLDYGADPNALDSDGKDVFSCMMATCSYDVLEYALEKGALISSSLLEADGIPAREHGILWEGRWRRPECYTPEAREIVRSHMPQWEGDGDEERKGKRAM